MLEGGQRLVEEVSLDLFHPNTVEARGRSLGLPGVLTEDIFKSPNVEIKATVSEVKYMPDEVNSRLDIAN